MSYTKNLNEGNVLKALAYLSEGKSLKVISTVHAILGKENIVIFIISKPEFEEVIKLKSVIYDEEKDRYLMLLGSYTKPTPAKKPSLNAELFNEDFGY